MRYLVSSWRAEHCGTLWLPILVVLLGWTGLHATTRKLPSLRLLSTCLHQLFVHVCQRTIAMSRCSWFLASAQRYAGSRKHRSIHKWGKLGSKSGINPSPRKGVRRCIILEAQSLSNHCTQAYPCASQNKVDICHGGPYSFPVTGQAKSAIPTPTPTLVLICTTWHVNYGLDSVYYCPNSRCVTIGPKRPKRTVVEIRVAG